MEREHELKVWPNYFDALRRGDKLFEVRRNDRDFQRGHLLWLREFNPDQSQAPQTWGDPRYTGADLRFRISYVLHGGQFGIEPGFAVLGLALIVEDGASLP